MRALLVVAIAAMAAPALAQADNAKVRAAAQAFDAAQTQGDAAALDHMLAPDFLFVRGSGRVGDRRDFIAGFTGAGQKLEPYTLVDPLFLRVTGDVAIVGGEARVKGTDGGKPFAEHFRYANTFVKREGRWIVVYTQITGLATK
jgi:ketosteroid isomerase-like protein